MKEIIEKTISSEVNQFPRLTWHHLHINHGNINCTLTDHGTYRIKRTLGVEVLEKYAGHSFVKDVPMITQMGKAFDQKLDAFQKENEFVISEFTVEAGKKDESVKLSFSPKDGEQSFTDLAIRAKENSSSTFILSAESPAAFSGSFGIRLRVLAEANALVKVIFVNLLGKGFTVFDANASLVMDNASVDFTQVQLGGKSSFTGVRHTLSGYRAQNSGRLAYVTAENNELDVNYVTHQIGKETESSFVTEGVLLDQAKKSWRGTIDFVKGCVDSKGNENENVLLLAPAVVNKSLPVILCDEEAVEGSHGTSVGKLGKEVLFYLQSRGVSAKEAERLMISAKVASVSRFIPDSELVQKIQSFVEGEPA